MPHGTQINLGPGNVILDGVAAPPKGAHPEFSANVCCGQTARWTKVPLGMEVGIGPCNFVFDGTQLLPRIKGHSPTHCWMDQDATWYGGKPRPRRRCVRWGRSSSPKATAPVFGPCLLWPNGWINEDATWHEVDLGPRHIVLDGDPAHPARGALHPPLFGPCYVYCGHGRPSQLQLSSCCQMLRKPRRNS